MLTLAQRELRPSQLGCVGEDLARYKNKNADWILPEQHPSAFLHAV
jgi:hypothetical protein